MRVRRQRERRGDAAPGFRGPTRADTARRLLHRRRTGRGCATLSSTTGRSARILSGLLRVRRFPVPLRQFPVPLRQFPVPRKKFPVLGLLVSYATGVFSSRKLERATYDSVAFRFIAANDHPDHDTIATFRRRFLKEIEGLFVQVLELAREMGMLKMGTVALDGTKIHANASRHSALSYDYAGKIAAQLKAEVADLLARAEAADRADVPDGMSIPE
jgi:Transposase domain (DUF772)